MVVSSGRNAFRLRYGQATHRWAAHWLPAVSHVLLIPEGFDGIEAGGLPGGVDAEDNSD